MRGAKVSDDSTRVRIMIDDLRRHYIHELKMTGVRSADALPLLHDVAYYTLNEIPDGPRMAVSGEASDRQVISTPAIAAEGQPAALEGRPAAADKRQTEMPAPWTEGP